MKINRGSEWTKWDLHVHTPFSIYQRFGNNDDETWEKYIIDLENLSDDFAVIGINDYLFLDGYSKLKKIQTETSRLSKVKLLPVVEFRIEKFAGINFEKLKRINLHVIFSDEIPLETIQSQFLNTLEQSYYLESGEPWTRAITPKSVEELGHQIKSSIPASELNKYGSDLTEGFNNLNVKEEEIFKSLSKDCFTGKYLIAIGKTEWGDLKWTDSSIATKKSIINRADVVFTAAESIADFSKAKSQLTSQGVNNLLLDCSDAHYLSTATDKDRIGNCNTWIKAQPTFEGLKQILHEPNQRILIQENKPDQKDEKLLITEVTFISENNLFTNETIHFNDNLNVIIGGKSSGKSILLYHIAKALCKDRNDRSVLKYFDTTDNLYKFFYDDLQNESPFKLKVHLASGLEQFSDREDNEPSILPEIKYIPQNHLSNLVDRSRKSGSTLKELIKELILEDPIANERYKIFEAEKDLNNSNKLKEIDNFFDLQDKIKGLRKDIQDKGSKDILITSIKSKNDEIIILQKDISDENKNLYIQYNDEIQKLISENKKIVSDYDKLKSLTLKIRTTMEQLQNDKNILINTLENENVKTEFATKYDFIQSSINEIAEIEALFLLNENKNLINESTIKNQILSNNQKKLELQEKIKPLVGQKESQDRIEALQIEINTEQEKLNLILSIENQIKETQVELLSQKEKIFLKIQQNFKEYENLISDLEPRTQDIEKKDDDEIDIKGFTMFNVKRFRESINSISDLRTLRFQNPFKYLYNDKLNNLSDIDIDKIINELKNVFDSILTGEYPLIKDFSLKEACRILLENHFFDHWEVKSGSNNIHNMSTGKASFVLLKLIIKLSKSEAPILIDQPEDNLDNRSISTELVNYLRDKKIKRQIILVTHNANIVVNADAENIIIANQKDENNKNDTSSYKFDYTNGSLEETKPKTEDKIRFLDSMGIREHIAEIVEGGKEAFKKREEKYGF
jgi:hypothetical protein